MELKEDVDLCDFLYYRRISTFLTSALVRTHTVPNSVTLISFFLALIAGGLFATGNNATLLLGVLFLQIARIFDCSDGELARLKGITTEFGWWLDAFLDRLGDVSIYGGLTLGYYRMSEDVWILFFGMLALSNVLLSGFLIALKSKLTFMKKTPALSLTKGIHIGGRSTHIFLLSLAVLFDLTYYLLLCYATVGVFLWIGQAYIVVERWKTVEK